MAKRTSEFVCSECGARFPKWAGKCQNCGEWNTLTEELIEGAEGKTAIAQAKLSGKRLDYVKINSIVPSDFRQRLGTGFAELDTVLGGGILLGSVILLTGQPGIGKSTLLMQICAKVAETEQVLYVSGEESAAGEAKGGEAGGEGGKV